MISINPILLTGNWDEGYALDNHIISSDYIGDDPFGHPMYQTKRTEVGELVFQLKYRNNLNAVDELSEAAASFLSSSGIAQNINVILPVPPSRDRELQPVFIVAEAIAEKLSIFYSNIALVKTSKGEAKNLDKTTGASESIAVQFTKSLKYPCNILLVDDIFHTGTTLNSCVEALRRDPNTKKVFVLTMTKAKGRF